MKKYFFTGLAILLPFALTLVFVIFLINLLTRPFQGIVESILDRYDLLDTPFLFFSGQQMLQISSKIMVLAALIGLILLIGLFGHLVILRTLLYTGDYILHRIPFINRIYKAVQDIVKTFFNSKKTSFSQVVLIPFPHSKAYSLGLISQSEPTSKNVAVFVPGAPNPTMGLMLTYKQQEVIPLDMKVDDAFKFIISCGIMTSEFRRKSSSGFVE